MKITIAENYERKNSRSLNYYCFIHSLIDASTTMEENIYMLTDGEIRRRLGQKIRHLRLRQIGYLICVNCESRPLKSFFEENAWICLQRTSLVVKELREELHRHPREKIGGIDWGWCKRFVNLQLESFSDDFIVIGPASKSSRWCNLLFNLIPQSWTSTLYPPPTLFQLYFR